MTEVINSQKKIQEYSVSEISQILKHTIEDMFSFVKIRGEISGLKFADSGHLYFNLKDADAVLTAICWKGIASSLSFKPEEGLEVVCFGRITTYPARSVYQLIVSKIEVAGVGALLAMLEKRKQKLAAEGLFDPERKKALPFLPLTIGIVTSPTGAVIRDILHRISDRFPVHVIIWPVLVQGAEAAEQIAAAINGFNNLPDDFTKPDLLIVARGGGSVEDLWAFNEEIVVRAAAASEIPLISAVGHETDTTLIDFVSDQRAPTPTAAAEIAVPVKSGLEYILRILKQRSELSFYNFIKNKEAKLYQTGNSLNQVIQIIKDFKLRLHDLQFYIEQLFKKHLDFNEAKIRGLAGKLNYRNLMHNISLKTQMLQNLTSLIELNLKHLIHNLSVKLNLNLRLLDSYNYKKVLKRGYSMIWDNSNKPLTTLAKATTTPIMQIEFFDGRLNVVNQEFIKKVSKE